jgi:hypothetical protein
MKKRKIIPLTEDEQNDLIIKAKLEGIDEINKIAEEEIYGIKCEVCKSRKPTKGSEVGYAHPTNRRIHFECFKKTQKKNETGWAIYKFGDDKI